MRPMERNRERRRGGVRGCLEAITDAFRFSSSPHLPVRSSSRAVAARSTHGLRWQAGCSHACEMVSRWVQCALVLAGCLATAEARAQCGAKRSSCSGCHDGARAPLPSREAWHEDHAFADLCPACHGGHGDAKDPAVAHGELVEPSSEERCAACHSTSLGDRYRHTQSRDAGASPPSPPSPHGRAAPNIALAIVAGALGAFGAAFVVRNERARGKR